MAADFFARAWRHPAPAAGALLRAAGRMTPIYLERRAPARTRQRFYAIIVTQTPAEDDVDQATLLRGRPPSFPLTRLAAVLAALRDWPPAWPSRAAIQFFDPK